MIILDSNVVSEPLRPSPDRVVMHWLDRQDVELLWFTSTGLAELLTGIELLPAGRRKAHLKANLAARLDLLFGERVLPLTKDAAAHHAALAAKTRAQGIAVSFADAQIAAIALEHGYAVATRDTSPFIAAGVEVIDPWEGALS